MTRCMQLPTKLPVKWALKPFKLVHATKWLAQVKVISYKMALKIGLIWAFRPTNP